MSAHPLQRWPAPKTFVAPGDEIKGTVLAWDGGDAKYPSLHIRTGDGLVRVVRVTQVRLHERLAELLPVAGDRIWIRYDGEAGKAVKGFNKTKEFTVEVRRAGSPPPNAANSATGEVQNEPRAEAGK